MNISSMLTWTPEYHNVKASIFPKQMAKGFLRQVLLDISFLHSHSVIHGDIHYGNILLLAPSLVSCTAEEVEHDTNASQ